MLSLLAAYSLLFLMLLVAWGASAAINKSFVRDVIEPESPRSLVFWNSLAVLSGPVGLAGIAVVVVVAFAVMLLVSLLPFGWARDLTADAAASIR